VTGGSLGWDEGANDFDWTVTDTLPASARGQFPTEPRYADLRWDRTEQDLSLQHPRFREAIADLTATIHGRPKDELIGEDVRQHRRTLRLTRSVIAAITSFAILVSVLAVAAWQARNRAEDERQVATFRFLSATALNSLAGHLEHFSVDQHRFKPARHERSGLAGNGPFRTMSTPNSALIFSQNPIDDGFPI
jgi:hypothetical protein